MDATSGIRATLGVVAHAARTSASAQAGRSLASSLPARAPLHADAAAALAALGDGPLQPSGPVAQALAAGRLLRTGDDATLDAVEQRLRTGTVDASGRSFVGSGVNGDFYRVQLRDPLAPHAPASWVVEKDPGAQAPQEEFGWRLARALGIDHLVPAAVRDATGTARIQFRDGTSLTQAGVTDVARLEQSLARTYLDDAALGLTPEESAQAARLDRQLLQVFDYLLANNDRRPSNGLVDAAGAVSFIDSGHAGRGTVAGNGGTILEPVLQMFQAPGGAGRVDVDPVVVELLRTRLDPALVRQLHSTVFDAPGTAKPAGRTLGERFIGLVQSDAYREGIVARLQQVLDHGSYAHAKYTGDNAGILPPPTDHRIDGARGFGGVRGAIHGGRF